MLYNLYIALWIVGIIWTFIYLWKWIQVVRFFNTQKGGSSNIPAKSLEIICTFRNEEAELPRFLNNCLEILQKIPVQITLVNDHSEDGSEILIIKHPVKKHPNFQYRSAPNSINGKKACLAWAVNLEHTNHVMTTDADCEMETKSIEALFHFHLQNESYLSLGLMCFKGNKRPLSQYQIIENTALVALSTYDAFHHTPTMGNAANMIFQRKAFQRIDPYKEQLSVAGGDDIFLIQAFQNAGLSIHYSNDIQTALKTTTLNTWEQLWHQRIRWAKKSQYQPFGKTQKSQIFLVLFLFYLWGISFFMGFTTMYVLPFSCWLLKIGAETQILGALFRKIPGSKPKFHSIILASLIQSLFIPLIAVGQFFVPVQWKGRKI